MRRFFSYGPINPKRHYFAPRKKLIDRAYTRLTGEYPDEDGHYITVWAPRQCGKTWVMQEVTEKIRESNQYEIGIISMERAKGEKNEQEVVDIFVEKMQNAFDISLPPLKKIRETHSLFTKKYFQRPVILILDEFDSLVEPFINGFSAIFRDIFISRTNERNKKSKEKSYLLHGLGLVGVRSVLGIENETGSPFNVQRSLHIPGLDYDEVKEMFQWYRKESGQALEPEVVERLFYEIRGQPGLTCWFGELLSEGFESYTVDKTRAIDMQDFDRVYKAAVSKLPNNNILNIISKADKKKYNSTVMKLFKTDKLIPFKFDDEELNYLYMHGVIDSEANSSGDWYVKFSCPFVQKRLFNYFSNNLFKYMDNVIEPFDNLEDVITGRGLNIKGILGRYQNYLVKNREWLFKGVPRRRDLRIFEAVFHFNLYMYLSEFLYSQEGRVYPEFPTGNGKIDLLIDYNHHIYPLELKSFRDIAGYKKALSKAALYGKQLEVKEIFIVFFIDSIEDTHRKEYESDKLDEDTGVKVVPVFIETGNP